MRRYCGRWEHKLRHHGYKCTATREVVLEVLHSTDDHLSPEDIYHKAHQNHPNIGLTTVYRTLELLEQTGIVSKFEFGHGRAKYELAEIYSSKKHHHHLICNKCRKIIDYAEFAESELEYIKKAEEGLEKKYGFKIDSHNIEFYGLCPECKG